MTKAVSYVINAGMCDQVCVRGLADATVLDVGLSMLLTLLGLDVTKHNVRCMHLGIPA